MPRIAVIADDLSGAVESAAVFLVRTTRITVTLGARPGSHPASEAPLAEVQVFDTDSRHQPAAAASARLAAVMTGLADVPLIVKKVDSLLRGNVGAELAAVRGARPHLVVATALPAAGRVVRAGRVWVGDRLLHETDAWRAEAGPRPTSVADVMAPLPTTGVGLDTVRGPRLTAILVEILETATIPVCDAENDDDLDRIAAAMHGIERPVLVGSAGIAAAAARQLGADPGAAEVSVARTGPVLAVVGSAAPGIGAQLEALRATDAAVLLLRPAELLAADTDAAAMTRLVDRLEAAHGPVVVVAVDAADGIDPASSRAISRALTVAVGPAAGRAAGLVLTGGETARAVLDRIGVTVLRPLAQVHHGAVVCVDDAGRAVATRPGSFGGDDSLLHLVSAVRAAIARGAPVPVPPTPAPAAPHPPEEHA